MRAEIDVTCSAWTSNLPKEGSVPVACTRYWYGPDGRPAKVVTPEASVFCEKVRLGTWRFWIQTDAPESSTFSVLRTSKTASPLVDEVTVANTFSV